MGLVYADGKYTTLTDILGAEDAFGDMDFKVAGTADAITALQLDTKIDGIPADVLAAALEQAKEARTRDPRDHERLHRRATCRGRGDGTEDHLDHHPDRQDRRGHRAEGQGHQHHPAGDRRRHRVDDDGAVGIVTIGAVEAWRMEEAKARDPGDRRSAEGRASARSTRAGS